MRLYIDENGQATKVDILKSAGPTPEHHLLDRAAAGALLICANFEATGKPTQVVVDYAWRL